MWCCFQRCSSVEHPLSHTTFRQSSSMGRAIQFSCGESIHPPKQISLPDCPTRQLCYFSWQTLYWKPHAALNRKFLIQDLLWGKFKVGVLDSGLV